ncbi:MAG: hypothetical protein VX642_09395 [Bdellovibrionota bacterium]|nr:hypothetical protein [Bdellovibrionota bacterium]
MQFVSLILIVLFSVMSNATAIKCPSITVTSVQITESIQSEHFQSKTNREVALPESVRQSLQTKFKSVFKSKKAKRMVDGFYLKAKSDCSQNKIKDTRSCKSDISIFQYDELEHRLTEIYRQKQSLKGAVSLYLDSDSLPNFCDFPFEASSSRVEIDITKSYYYMPFNTFIAWPQNFKQSRIDLELSSIDQKVEEYLENHYPDCHSQERLLDSEQKYSINLSCEKETFLRARYEIDPNAKVGGELSFLVDEN